MRNAVAIAVILAVMPLAGCDVMQRTAAAINPDTQSLADRCAAVMKLAMPFAEIDVTQRSSSNEGVRRITARVEGVRTDLAKDAAGERAVAAECQFDDSVLTAFRWTKGGPPPGAGQ